MSYEYSDTTIKCKTPSVTAAKYAIIYVSINSGLTYGSILPKYRYYESWDMRTIYPKMIQQNTDAAVYLTAAQELIILNTIYTECNVNDSIMQALFDMSDPYKFCLLFFRI